MMSNIIIRHATKKDVKLIFDIRNEKTVKEMSWNQEPLIWNKHKEWFNENHIYYWIINDNQGFIRIKDKEVSIAFKKQYRNMGIGAEALRQQCTGKHLKAEIKLDNLQSLYCFLNAGFKPVGLLLELKK